jgi:phosphoribosyl 1,2-cyclic phosphate phosphodiesterase
MYRLIFGSRCFLIVFKVYLPCFSPTHIGGIPDIRSYTHDAKAPLSIYGSEETLSRISSSFSYIFDPTTFVGGGIPYLNRIPINQPVRINDLAVIPIPVIHGSLKGCYGYRIGSVAYIPDIKSMPDSSYELCRGVTTLIVNCMRINREHVSHCILTESLRIAKRINATRTFFTHMSHEVDYEEHTALLDYGMSFAYDGLTITE